MTTPDDEEFSNRKDESLNESSNESVELPIDENESLFEAVSSTFLTEIDSGDEIRKKKKSKCENIPLFQSEGCLTLPVRPEIPPKPKEYSKKLSPTKTNIVHGVNEVTQGHVGVTKKSLSETSEHEQEISAALNQLRNDLLKQSESNNPGGQSSMSIIDQPDLSVLDQSESSISNQSEQLIQSDPVENVSSEFNNSSENLKKATSDNSTKDIVEETVVIGKVEENVEPPPEPKKVETQVEQKVEAKVEQKVETKIEPKIEEKHVPSKTLKEDTEHVSKTNVETIVKPDVKAPDTVNYIHFITKITIYSSQ